MDIFKLKREFLEYCELDRGQSVLTIANYDRYLSKFLTWLKTYKSETSVSHSEANAEESRDQKILHSVQDDKGEPELIPESIDQEAVRQYRLHINRLQDKRGRELKTTTQNYHMIALRAFLRYLSFRGVSSLSPEKINIAKTGDREITFLSADELEKMLSTPPTDNIIGLRDRALLETLFSTGMRVSEISALNFEDINFENGEIAVLGKGKKLRVVFLSPSALNWIDQYLKNRGKISESTEGEPLFISNKKTRLSVRTIERIVTRYATLSGLSKKVSPHTFRHSFATDLLSAGADVRSVQSLLGHSSITTTQIYTHVTDKHLREVHQAFHGTTIGHSEQSEEPHENK